MVAIHRRAANHMPPALCMLSMQALASLRAPGRAPRALDRRAGAAEAHPSVHAAIRNAAGSQATYHGQAWQAARVCPGIGPLGRVLTPPCLQPVLLCAVWHQAAGLACACEPPGACPRSKRRNGWHTSQGASCRPGRAYQPWCVSQARQARSAHTSPFGVQVRLSDGTRLAGRFNPSQTVGDLRRCG